MQSEVQKALYEKALDAVMNRPEQVVDEELSKLCDHGCNLAAMALEIVDALVLCRDEYKSMLTKIGDTSGDPQTKAAVYLAWKQSCRQLDEACELLGRDL